MHTSTKWNISIREKTSNMYHNPSYEHIREENFKICLNNYRKINLQLYSAWIRLTFLFNPDTSRCDSPTHNFMSGIVMVIDKCVLRNILLGPSLPALDYPWLFVTINLVLTVATLSTNYNTIGQIMVYSPLYQQSGGLTSVQKRINKC